MRREAPVHRLSPRELAELAAPAVERIRRAVDAASEPHPSARALELALPNLLGVEPGEIHGLWLGLDRGEAGGLCVEIELRLPENKPLLLALRRGGGAGRAAIRSGHFALSVRALRGEPIPRSLGRITERLALSDPPGGVSDAAGALLAAFEACERVERDPEGAFDAGGAPSLAEADAPVDLVLREYARYFGQPPALKRCLDAPGASIAFPARDLPDAGSFFHVPNAVRRSPSGAAYLRRLGFAWDAEGTARTVPTPATFRAARQRLNLSEIGFTPVIAERHSMALFARRWLLSSTRAELAINLGTKFYYKLSRPLQSPLALRSSSIRKDWIGHFTTIGHDMSVHLLGTHLMPRAVLLRIGDRVRSAMNSLPLPDRLIAPGPLLEFYDTDLFLHARERWDVAHRLSDLPGALASEASLGELLERLEARIAAARARRGLFKRQ
jgi:hypothetical protein